MTLINDLGKKHKKKNNPTATFESCQITLHIFWGNINGTISVELPRCFPASSESLLSGYSGWERGKQFVCQVKSPQPGAAGKVLPSLSGLNLNSKLSRCLCMIKSVFNILACAFCAKQGLEIILHATFELQ